ncbi:MAG: ribbon-helix-helix domain-containing protein [Gemmatimonadetes bacterium]|nr:ribbon-helix-helix domain-containing protein [Gemmatimonadota bacterium]
MRTTLNLDDDVLRAVKEIARLRGSTAGEVLSALAREALAREALGRGATSGTVRNGVPLLDPVPDAGIVTSADVAELVEDA